MSADPYRYFARFYDRFFESANRGLAEVTLGLAGPPAGGRALDVGCGTGVLLAVCADRALVPVGVDPSDAMLAVARRRLGATAALHRGSGTRLPFANASFDVVCATMVLHELAPDIRRATLGEMIRVTDPGGVLAIADYHDGPLQGPWGWLNRVATTAAEIVAGRAHWAGYRHFKAHGCLPGLVAGAPVTVVTRKIVAGGNLAVHVLRRR